MTSGTPYASVEELDSVTNLGSEYVYWRVSRAFALIELENFRTTENWEGTSLSEKPVLIYSAKSQPKYYEFRIIDGDKEIGTITAIAQKKDGDPTAYVLPYAPSYNTEALSKGRGIRIIDNGYPNVAYGAKSQAGTKIRNATDESGETIDLEHQDIASDFFADNPEWLSETGLSLTEVQEIESATIASNTNMWLEMDELMDVLVSLSTNDEVIAEIFSEIAASDPNRTAGFDGGVVVSGGLRKEAYQPIKNGSWNGDDKWWNWHGYYDYGWSVSQRIYYKDLSTDEEWNKPYAAYATLADLWCPQMSSGLILNYYGYTNKLLNRGWHSNVTTNTVNGHPIRKIQIRYDYDGYVKYSFDGMGQRSADSIVLDYLISTITWPSIFSGKTDAIPLINQGGVMYPYQVINGIKWASDNRLSGTTAYFPAFDTGKAEIDANRPFIRWRIGHYCPVVGYKVTGYTKEALQIVGWRWAWFIPYPVFQKVTKFVCTGRFYRIHDPNGRDSEKIKYYYDPKNPSVFVDRNIGMWEEYNPLKNVYQIYIR